MIPTVALRPGVRERTRQVALGVVALTVMAIGAGAWRLVAVRRESADLRTQIAAREARLAEDRRVANEAPAAKPDALDRSRAVSRLREALGRVVATKGCSVDEFQSSTDEAPYLTTYAPDNKDPGWMQVPVRIALRGRSRPVAEVLAGLRTLDVPFEVDTMELTRQATDNTGMATVVAQIALRVLVYKGES